jgi:proline dehydrogenase
MTTLKNQKAIDFSDTEIAFSHKTDKELLKTSRLYKLMSKSILVNIGSKLGLFGLQIGLPFTKHLIRNTIFDLFCGGTNLEECQPVIEKLYKFKTLTVLDYGAESKSSEEDLNLTMKQIVGSVKFAASKASVPVVSMKLTGLVDNAILEKWQSSVGLEEDEQRTFDKFFQRVDNICSMGHKLGVSIFIDAEESWMQDTIDFVVDRMMQKYNKEKAVVYNTYQLYRHDILESMIQDYEKALNKGYLLGAKLVRGAYMEKERDRALELGYPSPIHVDKEATDKDYNAAIKFCVDHYESLASCNATHNVESNLYQAELIAERALPRSHPHLNFSQLYGMSDFITFNLAEHGYNVAKYLPYGPINEVIPYLIRRAQENTSVTGEMGRELSYITKEVKRRRL